MTLSRLHGVNIEAPFALGHLVDSATVDLRVVVDAQSVSDQTVPPSGAEIILSHEGASKYTLFDCGEDGLLYRLYGAADFVITDDRRTVTCRPFRDVAPELMPILISGHVLATLLLLQGEVVMHASAVELNGRAATFLAHSGCGKSTVAAMMCRAGARVVADDVLRIQLASDPPASCFRGGSSLRLRPTSRVLASMDEPDQVSTDGRQLYEPEATTYDVLPLSAAFVLRLEEPGSPLSRARLEQKEALFQLLQFPRVLGWREGYLPTTHLDRLARILAVTPVYRLSIPWGVTNDTALFEDMLELVFTSGA